MNHHLRTTCRVCGGNQLRKFLSLGPTPLANSFLSDKDEFSQEPSFPLDVYFCQECSLVQLLDVIDPETLFRHYIYVTGTSDTIAEHNLEFAQTVAAQAGLKPTDLVVEIASNDGSLLGCFKARGFATLGIEPATNIAAMASARGIETLTEFFDSTVGHRVRNTRGPARVVIGNNVFAHVDEPRDFLLGCRHLIGNDGYVVIEVPYLREMIDKLEYDTIYHEHLSYFSASALLRLFETAGLVVARIDRIPVHGGSLRIYGTPKTAARTHSEDAIRLCTEETVAGLTRLGTFQQFACKVERNRAAVRTLLGQLNQEKKSLAAYGAPAKGSTLTNYCGLDNRLLPYCVDKNPLKVGRYTPGMHIPVLAASTLLERQPDFVLILAWNFADEIIKQQDEYRRRGGRFIIPVPEPRIV